MRRSVITHAAAFYALCAYLRAYLCAYLYVLFNCKRDRIPTEKSRCEKTSIIFPFDKLAFVMRYLI
jgi:hypothetical protein